MAMTGIGKTVSGLARAAKGFDDADNLVARRSEAATSVRVAYG